MSRVVRWWRARDVLVRDGAFAILLAAVALTPGTSGSGVEWGGLPPRSMDALGVALVLAQCLPLAVRRRWPAGSAAVIAAAFSAHELLGYPRTIAGFGPILALYSVGAHQTRFRRALAATFTVAYLGVSLAMRARGSPERPADIATFFLLLLACWVTGTLMRQRERHIAALAVAAERARIARDLHDVVTHHVTAMVVQADAAQFTLDSRDRTATGLRAISDTGRRALSELRHLLDVLDPTPLPLDELVEQARRAGQPVEWTVEGSPSPLAFDAELTAYRVVQEGLTNAVKHAPGRPTVVHVRYGASDIDVSVVTDGPPVDPRPGRGLTGLRERVGLLGGELSATGRPGGGVAVRARLPIGGAR